MFLSHASPDEVVHGGLLDADLLDIRVLLRLEGKRLRLHGLDVMPRLDALCSSRGRRPVGHVVHVGHAHHTVWNTGERKSRQTGTNLHLRPPFHCTHTLSANRTAARNRWRTLSVVPGTW